MARHSAKQGAQLSGSELFDEFLRVTDTTLARRAELPTGIAPINFTVDPARMQLDVLLVTLEGSVWESLLIHVRKLYMSDEPTQVGRVHNILWLALSIAPELQERMRIAKEKWAEAKIDGQYILTLDGKRLVPEQELEYYFYGGVFHAGGTETRQLLGEEGSTRRRFGCLLTQTLANAYIEYASVLADVIDDARSLGALPGKRSQESQRHITQEVTTVFTGSFRSSVPPVVD